LLVVVAIIALLISILLPALGRAKAQGRDAVCRANMHQLALATTYYADENLGRLPFMLGKKTINSSGDVAYNAPYRQYHQIFLLWLYLKDLKIYKCPAAIGEASVKKLYGRAEVDHYYFVFRDDDKFLAAYNNQWWPGLDPTVNVNALGEMADLYTEYWFNDYSDGAKNPATGKKVPGINGGVVGRIPLPSAAVVMSDALWDDPAKYRLPSRHLGGMHFAFLDAHVQKIAPVNYWDIGNGRSGRETLDHDPYGNTPFWGWGLTREGFDADVGS
jgi:prepilin-type processing-associated H-X9-DG protein